MPQLKTMMDDLVDGISPAEALRNAVILQAVRDYRDARRILRRRPDDPDASRMLGEISRFFCSRYFAWLSQLNGPQILQRLKDEVEA